MERGRPFEGGYASVQQMAIPGKPPSFSIMLPAKMDVYEGERLRLDCSVQGFPTPIGQFVCVCVCVCVCVLVSEWVCVCVC